MNVRASIFSSQSVSGTSIALQRSGEGAKQSLFNKILRVAHMIIWLFTFRMQVKQFNLFSLFASTTQKNPYAFIKKATLSWQFMRDVQNNAQKRDPVGTNCEYCGVTTMVRHVLELVWVPVSGTPLGLIKLLPSVSHASRWQANATNRKQRATAQKRDEHTFRWEGADCGFCLAMKYAARRIRNASGAESESLYALQCGARLSYRSIKRMRHRCKQIRPHINPSSIW